MHYDRVFGPSIPEKGWVPSPRFLLRRDRILRTITRCCPGPLIEVGCGAGTLLYELTRRGFSCEALEHSEKAQEIARYVTSGEVRIHRDPQPGWSERFDYVMAFEVLEHIDDHRAALSLWSSWLRPGGLILMSVPAHMSQWTPDDVWAGHYRRYERAELMALLSETGFSIEKFECYGFPLANILDPFRARVHARQLDKRRTSNNNKQTYHNEMSGVERTVEVRLYGLLASLPGKWTIRAACALQSWTINRDWGNGYFVVAKKREGSVR